MRHPPRLRTGDALRVVLLWTALAVAATGLAAVPAGASDRDGRDGRDRRGEHTSDRGLVGGPCCEGGAGGGYNWYDAGEGGGDGGGGCQLARVG
jgi:hypothetical protein